MSDSHEQLRSDLATARAEVNRLSLVVLEQQADLSALTEARDEARRDREVLVTAFAELRVSIDKLFGLRP